MRGTTMRRRVDWNEVRAVWDAMAPWRQANPYATPEEIREAAAHYLASMQPGETGTPTPVDPAPGDQEPDESLAWGFTFPVPSTP
jgi:hypothetical protein